MYQDIKTPQQLLEMLKTQFQYGWVGIDGNEHIETLKGFRKLFITPSLEQIMNNKLVTCIETSTIVKEWFDSAGIDCRLFCYRSYEEEDDFHEENIKMHILIIFTIDNRLFHFEYSNRPNQGIHEYASLEDALFTITKRFEGKWQLGMLTEIDVIPAGLTFKEVNEYVNSFDNINYKQSQR